MELECCGDRNDHAARQGGVRCSVACVCSVVRGHAWSETRVQRHLSETRVCVVVDTCAWSCMVRDTCAETLV